MQILSICRMFMPLVDQTIRPTPSQADHKPRRISRLSWILALALIGEVISLTTVPGIQNLLARATSYQAEPYAELYFTHPSELPKTYTAGASQTVAFTITNHEHQAEALRYRILLNGQVVATGVTSLLADGAATELSQTIHLGQTTGRARVTVTITDHPQVIQYWTNHE